MKKNNGPNNKYPGSPPAAPASQRSTSVPLRSASASLRSASALLRSAFAPLRSASASLRSAFASLSSAFASLRSASASLSSASVSLRSAAASPRSASVSLRSAPASLGYTPEPLGSAPNPLVRAPLAHMHAPLAHMHAPLAHQRAALRNTRKPLRGALVLGLLLFFCLTRPLPALDFLLRPRGFMLIPLGESAEYYKIGGGGEFGFDLDIASILSNPLGLGYTAGLEAAFGLTPVDNDKGDNLQLYSIGGGLGLYYFPLSRLFLRADAAGGYYRGLFGEGAAASWWLRAGGEAGFRFSPGILLSLNGGYRQYHHHYGGSLYSGIYAGLGVQITLETRRGNGSVEAAVQQDEAIFPIFLSLYREFPAATLGITNRESAEIRNVRVSFRAGTYTSSEFDCGRVNIIPKGRSVEIPLVADFSPELLSFTEQGRIVGEVVIRYTLLGAERQAVRSIPLQVYNRNAYRWGDPVSLAVFVSPTEPVVLETAKFITGLARGRLRSGLNRNMQMGLYLFEGLRAAGMRLAELPETPYQKYRYQDAALDTVQFPFQTLAYRNGDLDDLGLLYGALLEASGIRVAFLPLGDDFLTAFNLGISLATAETLFNGTEKLLIIEDQVWLPLSMAAFNRGFVESWKAGALRLKRAIGEGELERTEFVVPERAWGSYLPVSVPSRETQVMLPPEQAVLAGAEKEFASYIAGELEPLIEKIRNQISGAPTAALYNRLGILLIRAGKQTEAAAAYERAAALGSAAGMSNRGNISLLDRDYPAAEKWFRQALAADPENRAAQDGLEKARQE